MAPLKPNYLDMARAVRKPVKKILNQENAILRRRQLVI